MKRWLLAACTAALYILHQDFWNWPTAYPLVFGILPIGLFYHACYSLAALLLMVLLVRWAWPAHLEAAHEDAASPEARPLVRVEEDR